MTNHNQSNLMTNQHQSDCSCYRKDSMLIPGHYSDKYSLVSKEECHNMTMAMEPNLHHLADNTGQCNNFSVDSIMTTGSRDGSPVSHDNVQLPPHTGAYRPGGWSSAGGNSPPSYPACLYPGPGQTSLEELSSMTAACLSNQSSMGSLYPRPSW